MEEPASTLCLTTCYIKPCKPLGIAENPPGLGQPPPSRSCSCSRRVVKQEWSNSVSKCALPIIPEYPGFQDVRLTKSHLGNPAFNQTLQDLGRGKSSCPQHSNFPRRCSLAHCLGSSTGGCLGGHQPSSPGFQDKSLQDYFNERLLELGSYKGKKCSRRSRGFAEKSPSSLLALRGSWCRNSCSTVLLMGHGEQREQQCRNSCSTVLLMGFDKEEEQQCSSASQHSKRGTECKAQKEIQNVLKLYTGDFLDLLAMHITAPLEAVVQKK